MKKIFVISAVMLAIFSACTQKEREKNGSVFADAQWIGGCKEDMSLYAQYLTTFRLAVTQRILSAPMLKKYRNTPY